jgi:L-2-hydroxyglutarate oxidase LhgO
LRGVQPTRTQTGIIVPLSSYGSLPGIASPRKVGVIGAGIIGLSTAWNLLNRRPGLTVTILEKESGVGSHQTGSNSGVVHAGIYYKAGSLKAELCSSGRRLLKDFCTDQRLPYEECGKVLIATEPREEAALEDLFERGRRNGVPGLRHLSASELREIEPHACGIKALHSPTTAITDFNAIAKRLADLIEGAGGSVQTGSEVVSIKVRSDAVAVDTASSSFSFDRLVVCAGLQSDMVAGLTGDGPDPQIVPFRGDYMQLRSDRDHLVRGLIYPVPDPRYPFLGVHLTRTVNKGVLIGPSAILAGAREGYRPTSFDRREFMGTLRWTGFRKLARRHWRAGAGELYRTLNRRAFVAQARRFVPELSYQDVVKGPSGVRAQAVSAEGDLVDDFWINSVPPITNVRNAPSPGATSSLAIGAAVATAVLEGKLPVAS